MKHSGKARQAGLKLVFWTFIALLAVLTAGVLALLLGKLIVGIATGLVVLWIVFVGFTFYFFRDPDPSVPGGPNLIVSPGHGRVDAIEEADEPEFMRGRCQRVSMFLSLVNVHVQNAPVSGALTHWAYKSGKFLSAMRTESAFENECLLFGFDSSERPGEKIGVKLIAGLLARRIVPFVTEGETVARGDRISLIQFGSRVDLYLPRSARIKIKLGDHLVGGETVVAVFE